MMSKNTRTNKIITDVEERGLSLTTVIAINENDELVALSYNDHGLVSNISQGDKVISLYGKATADTNAMRELFTIQVQPESEKTSPEPDDTYGYGDDHTAYMGHLRSNY